MPGAVAAVVVLALAVGGWSLHAAAPPQAPAGVAPVAVIDARSGVLKYPPSAPQLAMIRSQAVQRSALPLSDTLNARAVYDEDATARIGVSIAGRVVAIGAAPGDAVKAGQMLVEIDSPDVGAALADLDKARADETRKQLAAERARALAPGDAIAARDHESAQADLAQARAETRRAEQRLNNLNPLGLPISGQRIRISSPIAGVVAERNVNPAMEVAPGLPAPLFVVTDPKRLWLMVDLPEKLLGQVAPGAALAVETDAWPGQRFAARVAQVGTLVDPNTRRVNLRARLDNPGGRLLPEMFVRAWLLDRRGEGVRLPNTAIVNRGLYDEVFVETAPGEFHRVRVVLRSQGAQFSVVTEGLAGGERVVVRGALLLGAELEAAGAERS